MARDASVIRKAIQSEDFLWLLPLHDLGVVFPCRMPTKYSGFYLPWFHFLSIFFLFMMASVPIAPSLGIEIVILVGFPAKVLQVLVPGC